MAIVIAAGFLFGCKQKEPLAVEKPTAARALFERITKEFHAPSVEAKGAERDRLLDEAARNYERLIKEFPDERDLCAQSLRALGNIHASQGKTDEAVKWMRTTADTGMPNYPLFARDPHLDRIRKEATFIQFMTELKTRWEGYRREFGEGAK